MDPYGNVAAPDRRDPARRPDRASPRSDLWVGILALAACIPVQAPAQEISRDEYLRFVPLSQPRLTEQTDASRRFRLYGDRSAPDYRDVDPRNGVDDARDRRLERIAVRFAPFMVRNTTERPLAFERFMRQGGSFPLHVDTWDLTRGGGTLADTETIDVSPGMGRKDQRRLKELLEEFAPRREVGGVYGAPATRNPTERTFRVLFFDFPGESPADWRRLYRNPVSGQLPRRYRGWEKIYPHPFLLEVSGPGQDPRYEFVMQYFAFYPSNDGGNNHEGDWQPINVVITLRGHERAALRPNEVRRVLSGDSSVVEELVIGRVEYFFHFNAMELDFLDPNVYRPRAEWRAEVRSREPESLGQRWIWRRIRQMAYRSEAEERVNTHPVVYIGGDNKGFDQLLQPPGGVSQDGHASLPFPGLWKDIGPGGAAEGISGPLNPHRAVYDSARAAPEKLVRYDRAARIRLLPDWERVIDLAMTEPDARRRWFWHVMPVRFGYPAVRSPFAGIVPHAPTGNLSTPGPSYNNKWNRTARLTSDNVYEPHKLAGTFPLGWQDAFVNEWGYLNLTLPTMTVLPPFDFAWRVLAAPVRAPFQAEHPTFFPAQRIPFRFVGVGGGVSLATVPDNFALLFTDPVLFDQLRSLLEEREAPTSIEKVDTRVGAGPVGRVEFHIGRRFTSVNTVRRIEGEVGFDIRSEAAGGGVVPVDADLELWEYAGSLRYNLRTGSLMPFLKAGYGLSWFRLDDATLGGEPLSPDATAWKRKPDLAPPDNLLPNTWHLGAGLEAVPIRNLGGRAQGLDVTVKASWSVFVHGLGLQRRQPLAEQEDFSLARTHLDLGLSLSY